MNETDISVGGRRRLGVIADLKLTGAAPNFAVRSEWAVVRLCEVSRIRSEKNRSDLPLLSVFLNRGVITYGEGAGQVHKPGLDLSIYQVVRRGDFVLNNQQAWRGSVGVSKHEGIISPAYIVLALHESINPLFADYLFQSRDMVAQYVCSSKGVGDIQRDIHSPWLKNVKVAMPPRAEQAAIVRFLDWWNGRLERAIMAKRKVIALLNEQKHAIIHAAVTGGLDPSVPLRPSGNAWLGDIPHHWEVLRLRHLIRGRLTYGANAAAEFTNPNWPRYIRITDFRKDGSLKADTFRSLPPHIACDYMVDPGDILLARSGATVGKAFLVKNLTGAACHAGYLIRVRPNRDLVSPEFLFAFTQSKAFSAWKDSTFNTATIQNIGADKYADLSVPLPSLTEQQAILDSIATKLDPLVAAGGLFEREIELLREYRARFVADVVTGRLDVREAAARLPDEASVADADSEFSIEPGEAAA